MTFFTEANENKKPAPVAPPAIEMTAEVPAGVGAVLKTRRLELGLKHKDVAKEIKIKAEYLKAIEDEEFDRLPTQQYLRLFIKTYAAHLGFDAQEIYSVFDTQEMPVKRPEKKEADSETKPPGPGNKISLPTLILISAGGIVVLFLLVVYLFRGEGDFPSIELNAPPDTVETIPDISQAVIEPVITPGVPSPAYQLEIRGLDSTWMVIQADDDTVFVGLITAGEVDSWSADSVFKFSLTNFRGVEAKINGSYLKPFRLWGGPVQAREINGDNLGRYLDSTRTAESPAGAESTD